MFRRLSKIIFVLPALLFFACAFADLRPVGISTVPKAPLAVLPEAESPVVIRFDTEMEKHSVEKAVEVYSPGAIVEGKFQWEGKALFFIPSAPWKAGIRYGLKLSGTVIAADGREVLLAKDIPFYAVSRSDLPYVVSFSPPDGASVGVFGTGTAPGSTLLEINFSHPMDSRSTEDALKIDLPGNRIIDWTADHKILRVSSDKPLDPWTTYRWSISEKALSAEGAPLAKEFSGRFVSDLEREFLRVVRVIPLMPEEFSAGEKSSAGHAVWGSWIQAGTDMKRGLGAGQGIGVEFNKPAESDSLRRAFSFAPVLPGRVEILSPLSAVFIPSRDPVPDTVYAMTVSGSVKDPEGLKMGEDYKLAFKADTPFLKINAVSSGSGEEKKLPESGALLPVKVNTGGRVMTTVHFSLPFDADKESSRRDCVFRISLSPFFPKTLSSVSLRSARWISSDRLSLEWEGVIAGTPEESHYYRLVIPGGSGGVYNGKGSYLEEDFILLLETK